MDAQPQKENLPDSESDVEVTILPSTTANQSNDAVEAATISQSNDAVEATTKPDAPSFFKLFSKTVGNVSQIAAQTGIAIARNATEVGAAAAKQTNNLISQATHNAGEAVDRVSENWLVRKVSRILNFDWLVGSANDVNLEKAAESVRKLQQEHPNESPRQIAHRIMVEKATTAGGIGLAGSIIPGAALALFAVDLAATTRLQTEMLYQIAAAYGLDLKEPDRRGEVLAVFGLALGSNRILKGAGLSLLRNVPFAGAMIGASSNAAMLYSLGYAACRFYEAKLDPETSVTSEEKLTELKEESDRYMETAIAQQAVMDQILVHMILANHPEKNWETILPELQALNLSENSLEVIANNIKSPQPLDELLAQLNRDFAIPLLAQCYRIAQQDELTNIEESRVIKAIATKFNIDLNSIKSTVNRD